MISFYLSLGEVGTSAAVPGEDSVFLSFPSTTPNLILLQNNIEIKTYRPLKLTTEQKQAAQLIQTLIKASWKSKKFKKKLIESPIKTIEKVTGKKSKLPEGFRVAVEDQSDPSIIYLNIPMKPKNRS